MNEENWDWESMAALCQSPMPGDYFGNFEAVAADEVRGPLGLLVQHISGLSKDRRLAYTLISSRGEILEPEQIQRLAASESFRAWQIASRH